MDDENTTDPRREPVTEPREAGVLHQRAPAPSDPAAQLQWLVDRALISDLLIEFARTLDERDWAGNTALYVPDGVLTAGNAFTLRGHEELSRTGTANGLGQYAGTWHLSSNHAIEIDGGTARTRSYLLAVHLIGPNTYRHADGAGWYDCTLRRTADGWRFVTVSIWEIWHAGEPLPHVRQST